ncbi:MAG TPA: (2Fe-2S)-binding protein [Roseiflexaceae bacterium]|nr:(2Fe-2S)-binding protein [Roseiflexaceae bacterium]
MAHLSLTVNGAEVAVEAPPDTALLHVLRDHLGLTGAKIGCGEGACGTCTVLVDGQPARACVTPAAQVAGAQVLTIEGLAADSALHPLQRAFLDTGAFQCGYCTPGMIMAALGLLRQRPDPSEEEIVQFMQGNICRCGMYARIVRAIRRAAAELRATGAGGAR